MWRAHLIWIGVSLAGITSVPANGQLRSAFDPTSARAILDRYCVSCHNQKLKTATLSLEGADLTNVGAASPIWEKVVRKLRTRAMPPAGMPRPDDADYNSLAAYLENKLDRLAALRPNPGRTGAHRLNRTEYSNAVRDLLALDIDAGSFLPPDTLDFGFDNNADVLSVSPLLMERYVALARRVSRLAVGDSAIRPDSEQHKAPLLLQQEDRESEDLPFGSRGGLAFRYRFPLDGQYVIKVRLQRNETGYIRGLDEPHLLDVRVDGERIKQFIVGGEHRVRPQAAFTNLADDMRIASGKAPESDPEQIKYDMNMDDGLEVRFPAKAGTRMVGVSFAKENERPEGVRTGRMLIGDFNTLSFYTDVTYYRGGLPLIDWVGISGPYEPKGAGDTLSRRKIFVCRPDRSEKSEDACAKKIVATLAHRAYRRPVTDQEVQDLLALFGTGRKEGGFENGIEMALQGILAGPEFLFRSEQDPPKVPPNSAYKVSDLELASRLSFFLWSTIPDDELLGLAERGRLSDPVVLQHQVERMLASPLAKAFVTNFADQWLSLRNVRSASMDQKAFPNFDDELREAFIQETELFFESMVRDNRPVPELLSANYTFVNERLARHYGIPNVSGSDFRRVQLPEEARRGLLGQGSILIATSRPNRTSPVLRGKWVLDNLLGSPPPPPPPNVPALKEKADDGSASTVRQRLEQHRAEPVCAGCHARMDPIGFALDNFDAIGQWRTNEAGLPLNVSGKLDDGTALKGPLDLQHILASRQNQFVTTTTEKLLTYALGREVQYYDQPAIRKIIREASADNYRWSSLVLAVTRSVPFQMRRSQTQ